MARPVGYYVHHQGAGHLHRARLIAGALRHPCTLMGTSVEGSERAVVLPDDRMRTPFEGVDDTSSRPKALHYAPVNHIGVRTRMAAIAAWVAANDPALMIIDVSVEAAIFARLLSTRVLLVRLAGQRNDQAHLEAFRAAEALIAPFPTAFESPTTPAWVIDKTIYAGFLAPITHRTRTAIARGEIAVVLGCGGAPNKIGRFAEAALATPEWTWRVYGDMADEQSTRSTNLLICGWVDDIGRALDRAEIVVGGAGDGLLAAVVGSGKRFICLPEQRAFDEQVAKANVLSARELAIVLPDWPPASKWPAILARAGTLDAGRLHAFYDPDAVAKIAAKIDAICVKA